MNKKSRGAVRKTDVFEIAALLTIHHRDYWTGRMPAEMQRTVFGKNLFGKKKITVNCDDQGSVEGSYQVCFGNDFNTFKVSFGQIARAVNDDWHLGI